MELLTADHTFLNERLARHYGISGVTGPQFRRVTLTDKDALRPAGQGCGADCGRRMATARLRCCVERGCSTS